MPPPTTYVALRTADADGVDVTDQPTSGRIIATGPDFSVIERVCRLHSTNTYHNRVTDETFVLSDEDIKDCPWTNEARFAWLCDAEIVKGGSRAILVRESDLVHYEPDPPGEKRPNKDGCLKWSEVRWYRATVSLDDLRKAGLSTEDFPTGTQELSERTQEFLSDLEKTASLYQVDGVEISRADF